ncbi:MAG: hypothetical protein ACLPID_05170 [Beijerinckiaceae bacterium]
MFHPNIDYDQRLCARVPEGSKISRRMAQRLSDSYKFAIDRFPGHGDSFWAKNDERNADLIAALRGADIDAIGAAANDPARHDIFWGIDDLTRESALQKGPTASRVAAYILLLRDSILRLAEAIGAIPIWHPEEAYLGERSKVEIDRILDAIERRIGVAIDFPNPFPNEFGIGTSRGIASYRTFQAIYQAWRLLCLSERIGKRIVELGPGLGRTAYYARKFGLLHYTTIDTPLGNIAQACFLSHALGESAITLPGEPVRTGEELRIETPAWYMATSEKFDIVLNVESMPEMAFDRANAYAERIVANSHAFVSINHEINTFLVRDLPALKGLSVQRFPYWMRQGFVEEVYMVS